MKTPKAFKNPVKWAQALSENVGFKTAYKIVMTTGREFIGHTNDIKNPSYEFYYHAKAWIVNNTNVKLNVPEEST